MSKEAFRVVLTNTKMGDRICPPLNLCSLAGSGNLPSVDTKVLDSQRINDPETLQKILSIKPNLVGITDTTPTHKAVIDMAEKIKKNSDNTLVVIGGKHPTLFAPELLDENSIDLIVAGEGEEVWKTIIETSQKNKGDIDNIKSDFMYTNGVLFHGKTDLRLTPQVNLSVINSPDYNLLYPSLESYKILYPNLEVDIERARGCVGSCPFCVQGNSTQRGIRTKNINQVYSEIEQLVTRGFQRFFLTDDDVAAKPSSTVELCKLISAKLVSNISFSANVRVDTFMNAEKKYGISQALKNAGFSMLYIGLESGSPTIQEYNRKMIDRATLVDMLRVANANKIAVKLNLIIGSPFETRITLSETKSYLFGLRDSHLAFIPNLKYFLPYPGTQSFDDAVNLGILDPKKLDLSTLESHTSAVIPTGSLSISEINAFYHTFLSEFYTNNYLNFIQEKHSYMMPDIQLKDHSVGK